MDLFRRPGLLLLPIALVVAGARPAAALAGPRLLAPETGAELAAGSLAAIAWQDPPADAEEWEAFLSLDGGKTYPLRITPHLNLAIRRFTFRVPPFPTRDARVLLRFGDERREVEIEAAQRFAIVRGVAFPSLPMRAALSRGERPRPQDPGVVMWVEGSRDGSGLREVAAAEEDSSVLSIEPVHLLKRPPLWRSRHRTGWAASLVASQTQREPFVSPRDSESHAPPPVRLSVRRLTGRLNE